MSSTDELTLWSTSAVMHRPISHDEQLSFGEMIKKKVNVHYCKLSEIYERNKRCNQAICDFCKTKDEESMGGNRRSRRMRN